MKSSLKSIECLAVGANTSATASPRRAFIQVNHAVQTRISTHLNRRSQRGYRPPSGRTIYEHLCYRQGMNVLRGHRKAYMYQPTKPFGKPDTGNPHVRFEKREGLTKTALLLLDLLCRGINACPLYRVTTGSGRQIIRCFWKV